MQFLGKIACDSLIACPWEDESYILTCQEKAGDTHGWHWGDYSYTIIHIVEAPSIDFGGMLQCVPHTYWDKSCPRVNQYLTSRSIDTYYHASGGTYFLKSDTTLGSTVPLQQDATRILANLCWGSKDDACKIVDHGTMTAAFV